jgi:hypothetical protein
MLELDLPHDYSDLLLELLDAEAEFVVLGGWAVAVHGHGRATDYLDILVRVLTLGAAPLPESFGNRATRACPSSLRAGCQPSHSREHGGAKHAAGQVLLHLRRHRVELLLRLASPIIRDITALE